MNVSVEIHVVTETGPDGMSEAIDRCVMATLALVGKDACGQAAAAVWVETDAG